MAHPRTCAAALALAAALAGLAGCASGVRIHTLQSPDAHFERYRTVSFEETSATPKDYFFSPRSMDVRSHVETLAASILQSRGYVLATGKQRPDLVIRVEAGRRERTVSTSLGTTPLGGGPGDAPPLAGGDSVSGPATVEMMYHGQLDEEERDLVDGAFVIDAFDDRTRALVWHGSAHTVVAPGYVDYDHLRRSVESVLARFPAGGSSGS